MAFWITASNNAAAAATTDDDDDDEKFEKSAWCKSQMAFE